MTTSRKVTTAALRAMKAEGRRIVVLTAYDWTMARLLDAAGVDLLLVGDSVATVVHGEDTTVPVTVDQGVYHCRLVTRGAQRAFVVGDLPFLSYQICVEDAPRNAGRLMKEARVEAVKLEGGQAVLEVVRRLLQDARDLAEAGAFALVLDKVPASLAAEVTRELPIPTIGIGAGPGCDGQILVTHDMLGLFDRFKPRFARRYRELGTEIRNAAGEYAADVRAGTFPDVDESY